MPSGSCGNRYLNRGPGYVHDILITLAIGHPADLKTGTWAMVPVCTRYANSRSSEPSGLYWNRYLSRGPWYTGNIQIRLVVYHQIHIETDTWAVAPGMHGILNLPSGVASSSCENQHLSRSPRYVWDIQIHLVACHPVCVKTDTWVMDPYIYIYDISKFTKRHVIRFVWKPGLETWSYMYGISRFAKWHAIRFVLKSVLEPWSRICTE